VVESHKLKLRYENTHVVSGCYKEQIKNYEYWLYGLLPWGKFESATSVIIIPTLPHRTKCTYVVSYLQR
jgi:hypothetical protein